MFLKYDPTFFFRTERGSEDSKHFTQQKKKEMLFLVHCFQLNILY